MIEVITKHNIDELLADPEQYVDSDSDVVLVKVHSPHHPGNPVMVMLGRNNEDNTYYFLLEDNEVVIDTLDCDAKDLPATFQLAVNAAQVK